MRENRSINVFSIRLLLCRFFKLWSYYAGAAGKDEKDANAKISGDEFMASVTKLVNDKDHPEKLSGPLPLFFHAVDRYLDTKLCFRSDVTRGCAEKLMCLNHQQGSSWFSNFCFRS